MYFLTARAELTALTPFVLLALALAIVGKKLPGIPSKWAIIPLAAVAMGFIVEVLVFDAVSLASPGMPVGQSETGLMVVAQMFLKGLPMYPDPGSAPVYGLLYGPLSVLPFAGAFWLWHNLYAACILVVLVGSLALWVTWLAVRKEFLGWPGLAAALSLCALLVPDIGLIFTRKGDGLILLMAALPWVFRNEKWFLSLTAICAGIAFNIKITTLPAFLPQLAFGILGSRSWGKSIQAAALLAVTIVLPFLVPGISVGSYWKWVGLARDHHVAISTLLLVLVEITIPFAFFVALWPHASGDRDLRFLFYTIILAAVLTIPAVIKVGSGGYQLLPLLPSVLVWFGTCFKRHGMHFQLNPLLVSGAIAAAAVAFYHAFPAMAVNYTNAHVVYVDEEKMAELIAKLPKPVSVISGAVSPEQGGDGNYRMEDKLPDAIFDGATLEISPMSMLDLQAAGQTVPQEVISNLSTCRIPTWIGLAGQKPFIKRPMYDLAQGRHAWFYDEGAMLFGYQLPQAFYDHYEQTGSFDAYTIWTCKKASSTVANSASLVAP